MIASPVITNILFRTKSVQSIRAFTVFIFQVERANYLLNSFVECAKKGETYEGRLLHHLLFNPSEDGGQWDMLTNLVEKHGVVPKALFPEAEAGENSRRLERLTNNRVIYAVLILAMLNLDLFGFENIVDLHGFPFCL